jgi:hypothetical protein
MDADNPRHSSTSRSSPRLRSPARVPDVKARVCDQAVQRTAVTCPLSRGECDQLLLSLGKKLRYIVEVVMAEGAIGMGLVLAALCAPLPRIYDSRVWCVIRRYAHQQPHHTTNTISASLG